MIVPPPAVPEETVICTLPVDRPPTALIVVKAMVAVPLKPDAGTKVTRSSVLMPGELAAAVEMLNQSLSPEIGVPEAAAVRS